jgi:outer membrane lipoprotein-sorting protein
MYCALARVIFPLALLGLTACQATAAPDPNTFSTSKIHTLTLNVHVTSENRDELNKIPGDFAQAYRFHNLSFSYEQPGKLHYEAVVLGAHIAYTINGNKKYTSIPSVHMHQVEDVTGAPLKKQTLLDVGLISPEFLTEYNATYNGMHGKLVIFTLMSKVPGETSKDVVWMDPATHITARRYHYNRDGKLINSFVYSSPIQVSPGMYVPTQVQVYNQYDKLAAVSSYTDIKANLPISESIFDF